MHICKNLELSLELSPIMILTDWKSVCSDAEVCVRNLKALNIDVATYGIILVPSLNGKLT